MKILNVEFSSYQYWCKTLEQFNAHQAKVLETTLIDSFGLADWDVDAKDDDYQYAFNKFPTLATEAQVAELLVAGFEFTATAGTEINPEPAVLFNPKVPEGPSTEHHNHRLEVHMPGQALAMYNDTMLMEDSCTDALQNELANGWRIIAVCPQPDQRRPDYVLGRYNPNVGVDTSAKRG